jgi:hypothetical protein
VLAPLSHVGSRRDRGSLPSPVVDADQLGLWRDAVVPLLAALIGALIGGVASYVSATRAARYTSSQAETLARKMFRLEREVKALEEVDVALTPLRERVDGAAKAFALSPQQMSSSWAGDLREPLSVFLRRVAAPDPRLGSEVRTALKDFASGGWDQRIIAAEEQRRSQQDQASIDTATQLTLDLQRAVKMLLDAVRSALGA